MTREQTLDILCAFQAWRRYDGPIGEGPLMPGPKEIGEAIDIAIEVLSSKENPQYESGQPTVWTIDQLKAKDLRGEKLTTRALERCLCNGIGDVYELAGWEEFRIKQIRNLGKKTFHELDSLLKKYRLSWGMWESESAQLFKQRNW